MKQSFFLILIFNFITLYCRSQDTTKIDISLTYSDTTVFEKVDIEATFPGGVEGWKKYLIKNLKMATPVNNAAPAGVYKVVVKFIVSKDGAISNIAAETKHGYGMEEEVIRIIKKGPDWIPANINGKIVNAYRRQPITFAVSEN